MLNYRKIKLLYILVYERASLMILWYKVQYNTWSTTRYISKLALINSPLHAFFVPSLVVAIVS